MSGLTWYGAAEPVSRDQVFKVNGDRGENKVSCSADLEKDCQS